MDILDHLEPNRTMNMDFGDKEVIIRELTGFEASVIDTATLRAIRGLIEAHDNLGCFNF